MRLFCLVLFFAWLAAEIPPGYYDDAEGLEGDSLRLALHHIIDDHNAQSYGSLHDHYESTDVKPDGTVWDMYSDIPGGTPPYIYNFTDSDQCGNYTQEGDCYNREHSWPKSWFNDAMPMKTDLFHVYPTDGYVNGMRSNYPYGEVESASWTSQNGSKRGAMDGYGFTGTVFEPIDEYKGDFARTYFYMSTRYYTEDSGWDENDMVIGADLKPWALDMLMDWHEQDTVSQKETDRNDAVYDIQGNRNPFIDHPEWVVCIWDECESAGNLPPVANAGEDQLVGENEIVTLDGSDSYDPENAEITFFWNAPTGILLSDPTSATPSFTTPMVEDTTGFIFTLMVSDGELESEHDTVIISVYHTNVPPVANAGEDQVAIENDTVILDGTASSDFENDNLSYAWSAPQGIELDDSTRSMPTFVAPEVEDSVSYVISLIVSDGELESAPDTVMVTVLNSLGLTSNLTPEKFILYQPYPNPFNPTTTIEYDLPNSGRVDLAIYDVLGKRIHTLVFGNQQAGFKSVVWDATNDFGQPVSAGLYFYTLKTKAGTITQKMLLLK
jgi:endonuclease I